MGLGRASLPHQLPPRQLPQVLSREPTPLLPVNWGRPGLAPSLPTLCSPSLPCLGRKASTF